MELPCLLRSGSVCMMGWKGEGVAGLRFAAGITHTQPHTPPATLFTHMQMLGQITKGT